MRPSRVFVSESTNHVFDPLSSLRGLPCIRGVFKVEDVRDQRLDRNTAGLEHIHGDFVVARPISKGTVHVQFLLGHGQDGEADDRLPQSCLHTGPSRPQDMDGRDDGALRARSLNHRVRAQAQAVLLDQPPRILLGRDTEIRLERPGATEPPGELELMLEQIHRHDRLGPIQSRECRTQQADSARPKHDDTLRLGGPHVNHAHGVCGHGQRLRQHALLQRHPRRQFVAQIARDLEVLGQRAVGVRRTGGELHVRTQIVQALLAARADAARLARFDGDVVAWREVRHGRADGVDRPGRFVAHHEGLFWGDGLAVDSAVGPEMDLF